MNSFKQVKSISSWLVFAIAMVVYYLSAERTGSLWDCGEFILGAYKLQVVHPPGAPLFMLVGRIFTWIAELVSNDPADIAFAVNLMSGLCTAFTAFFVSRITMLFGQRAFQANVEDESANNLALGLGGLVAGLATAFCSSIWFSAVEGEVYAMSTMFTALTFWAATKWYIGPDNVKMDRWLLVVAFLGGLSIGVHLLSLLTFPAIGLMYYYKKYDKHTLIGSLASIAAGAAVIVFIQNVVIVGIVEMWANFDLSLVNDMGLPFNSGLVLALLLLALLYFFIFRSSTSGSNAKISLIGAAICFGIIALFGWGFSIKNIALTALFAFGAYRLMQNYPGQARYNVQMFALASLFTMIGFSTIGVIVLRAHADTPINMNTPSDAMRLLPYLNREQYGERALMYGPHFDAKPIKVDKEERYGKVGDKYEVVSEKFEYVYDKKDKIIFPRIGHTELSRPQLHRQWYQSIFGKKFKGKPSMGYNIRYMMKYQMGWMYWRYFFWNFVGKQNGEQGYYSWDKRTGHWQSGIKLIDEMKLYNMDQITDTMKSNPASNKYFFLPLLFGLIGLLLHFRSNNKDFKVLMMLFLMTGLGITMYSNQPPSEPRERDYVLVGSFFTFCMWIGMSAPGIFKLLSSKLSISKTGIAGLAGVLALSVPLIMGFQNFDDHSRKDHYGSRDYASNFLESCKENAIIFTYGDNDTYPLWYAQEVENIRRDVRVVNLSLIAVDWYIDKLRSRVNDSAPLKLTLSPEAYLGDNRNQVFFMNRHTDKQTPINVFDELRYIGDDRTKRGNPGEEQSVTRSRHYYLPIDVDRMLSSGVITQKDSSVITNRIDFKMGNSNYFTKDDLAVLDLIASNIYDRPIYFAVTCKNDKLLGINDHLQIEGLGLRVMPIKVPSDPSLKIFGSGRVATDIAYDNITTKWKWGNFDKIDTHISSSYGAELQAMKVIMMRTSEELMQKGEFEKAANIAEQYFSAFPHFNFAYDDSITPFIRTLTISGRKDEASKHLRILGDETFQNIAFYESLDEEDFEAGFQQDYGYAIRAVSSIMEEAKRIGDQELIKEISDKLGRYDISRLQNPQLQN